MLKWLNNKKKDNKGFSLVELIIVVAIMAILVGLLAPQYIKYVEKSRKSADASNMSEMVNAIQVYAADSSSSLSTGGYQITIPVAGDNAKTTVKGVADSNSKTPVATDVTKVTDAIKETMPEYESTVLKSNKWGNGDENLVATIYVTSTGGTTVTYQPNELQELITNKKN